MLDQGLPDHEGRKPYAWAGSVGEFLEVERDQWLNDLTRHYRALTGEAPGAGQRSAWLDEWRTMRDAFSEIGAEAHRWSVVAEFELPFEGGRRPDIVVLVGTGIVVLEYKAEPRIWQAHLDQADAYRRDLVEYHEASHACDVRAVVVATNPAASSDVDGHNVIASTDLARGLREAAHALQRGPASLSEWLAAPYAPLPTLIAAARRIFREEELPRVKRAMAAGLPEVVERVRELVLEAKINGGRRLILVTGVPGAGKTLVGLQLVYEQESERAEATFLSGNGPLVAVLQDALKSSIFVRDLHKFITSYGLSSRTPEQQILVFDEAQRAWDRDYMAHKGKGSHSEPELLARIAERLPNWAVLVGLVGQGQEIHSGEESGLVQWRTAISESRESDTWTVVCPAALAPTFDTVGSVIEDRLALQVPMRSRRAERLHDWVVHLLDGDLNRAAELSSLVASDGFPVYVTRSLDAAKRYARERYDDAPEARYGLLVSSQAKGLLRWGIDNSFMATNRIFNVARWFNAPADDTASCCALEQVATEFGCQGLELDLPIVVWGADYLWEDGRWRLTPIRRRYRQHDPNRLLTNAYRVLLTRGRDGVVVFVPPTEEYSATASALESAGATILS